jgi:phosphatidylinositol phospholipase C, delta
MRKRDQSAGPTLVRRRSDSNGASDMGEVSDLELDSTAEDVNEDLGYPPLPLVTPNALGISYPRPSDASTQFEGGVADAVPATLQVGTWLDRLTRKRKKPVRFWLDAGSARVCWYGKVTTKSFGIDDVVSVRRGAESRNARDDIQVSPEDEDRLLTIVYAVDDRSDRRSTKALHLLMPSETVMNAWTGAVDHVTTERAASMKALSLSNEKSEKGMSILWRQAMQLKGADADEVFQLEDARRLCRQLQINCSNQTVASHFKKADADNRGSLTYAQYRNFVKSFKERQDVQHMYRNIKHGLDSDLELEEFMRFLKDDQGVDVEKDRSYWESIFDKYARPTQNRPALPDAEPAKFSKGMDVQGFQNFLSSSYNGALQPIKTEVTFDRPLNEYFISSSHNTYLLGYQVRGTSSVEGYITALIGACRCIEIDCWDGDDGRPMVTHGRTLTSKIPFEDCVSVIAKYAFHSTPYPLIISLEVHCNPAQQEAMVDLMINYFGALMVTEPLVPNSTVLPSPEELKERILIKVKASDDNDQSQLLADASNGRSRARSLSSAVNGNSAVNVRSPSVDKLIAASSIVSSPATTSPSDFGAPTSTPRGSTTSGPTTSPTSSEESDEGSAVAMKNEAPPTSKIVPRLGRLGVYTQGISFPKAYGFSDPKAKTHNHIFSFSEDTFSRHSTKKQEGGSKAQLQKHNLQHLMRVYPGRRRIWSQNFNPMPMWRLGVQMVALNWQTYDVHQQVNRAMFAAGSDSLGYVLKPDELRQRKHTPILVDTAPATGEKKKDKKLVRFSVEIISAQRLPRPKDVNVEAGMNPYIEFEMYAAEDKGRGTASGEGGTDVSASDGSSGYDSPLRKRTKVVLGNGFDPTFNEPISMQVVTKHPSLIFVRWTVWHQGDARRTTGNNVQLATFTAKLSSLQQGYRHLPLFNPQGERYQEAKLFVKIRKEAPVAASEDEKSDGVEYSSSPRPEPIRADRSWPRRIFSRNPSEHRKKRETDIDQRELLSRTSSMDRESFKS